MIFEPIIHSRRGGARTRAEARVGVLRFVVLLYYSMICYTTIYYTTL